jgi:hypothetical protein
MGEPVKCGWCNGTGVVDSGGVEPWGAGIDIPCGCEDEPEPQPWRPSPEVHAATVRLINSIINSRVPEENYLRDDDPDAI